MVLEGVRVAFFDADDTLFSVRKAVGTVYSEVAARHGVSSDPDEMQITLYRVWEGFSPEYHNEQGGYRTDPAREKLMWRKFCQLVIQEFGTTESFNALFEEIYTYYARGESRLLNPHIQDLLGFMQENGIATGVLTNNDGRVVSVLRELQVDHLFDHFFPAGELGFKKPSLQCFQTAQERVGYAPEEMLYIGDSLELDYYPSQRAGWRSIFYNRKGAELAEEICQVQSFQQLLG